MSSFSDNLLKLSNDNVHKQAEVEYGKIKEACRLVAASGNFYYIHPWKLYQDVNIDIIRLLIADDLTLYELDLQEHCGCDNVTRGNCFKHPQNKLVVTWRPNFNPVSLADSYLYTATQY